MSGWFSSLNKSQPLEEVLLAGMSSSDRDAINGSPRGTPEDSPWAPSSHSRTLMTCQAKLYRTWNHCAVKETNLFDSDPEATFKLFVSGYNNGFAKNTGLRSQMAQIQGPTSSFTSSTKAVRWKQSHLLHILPHQQDKEVSWDFSSENKVRNKIRLLITFLFIHSFNLRDRVYSIAQAWNHFIALVGLELMMYSSLVSNLQPSFLSLLRAEIPGLCQHAWLSHNY